MESLTSVHIERYCGHVWAIRGYRGENCYRNHDPYCFVADVHLESNSECEIKAALGWLGDGPKARLQSCLRIYTALAFRGVTRIWGDRAGAMPLGKKIGNKYLVQIYGLNYINPDHHD